jgi:hypothetical protein
MFVLAPNPAYKAFSVRPVDKTTDRLVIRNIFRQAFYGDNAREYTDDGLWEMYRNLDTRDIFGAYLVYEGDTALFLLEIHPPLQMDLTEKYLLKEGEIGIYCFILSPGETANLPAIRACIGSLLTRGTIERIITALSYAAPADPMVIFLEKAGFERLTDNGEPLTIYQCTRESFQRSEPSL